MLNKKSAQICMEGRVETKWQRVDWELMFFSTYNNNLTQVKKFIC